MNKEISHMPNEQVRTILEKVVTVHSQVAEFYSNLKEKCSKERVKLLLDYLKSHEVKLKESIAEFEKEAQKSALESYVGFTPDQEKWNVLKNISISPESSYMELVEAVLSIDEKVLEILQDLAKNSETQSARSIFDDLLLHSCKERNRFVRDAMMMEEC